MLGPNHKWSEKINFYCYTIRGLTNSESNYINNKLNKEELYLFVNLRYPVDPIRYDKMTKKQLLKELKYNRYN
jgi:hypothetical protein